MKNIILIIGIALIFGSCQNKSKSKSENKKESTPVIFVSNYPLQFFVESIADDKVEVIFPPKESGDPAYWQPKPDQIANIQKADLIIINGASYEKWMENISLSASKIVSTTANAEDKLIKYEEAVTHSHGPEGEHAHIGTAFTTWLDFSLAKLQAKAVYESLISKYPTYKDLFSENYTKLINELTTLDKQLTNLTSKNHDIEVVFSHPVYQYLQKRYSVHGHSVHWEPDSEITADMWHDLDHAIEGHGAKWMVWEGDPATTSIEALAKKGMKSVVFDPCGNVPENGDFLSVMKKNITELEKVYN